MEAKSEITKVMPNGANILPSIPERKKMLAKKQEALRLSIKELEDSVSYIDWKQNFYDEVLSGKRPYVSNLIPSED